MIVRKMFDLSGGAELPDIFFGSFGSNMKTLSNGEIRAAVEFRRKIIEKRLAENSEAARRTGIGGRKIAEDMSGMLQKHTSHGERSAEIGIGTDGCGGDRLAIHETKYGENHSDTECDETETTHGGDDIETEETGILLLDLGEKAVELGLLR